MNKLRKLNELGQAVWLDYIRRSFVTSGELAKLVDTGLTGVTSNPTIFDKAISGSTDYDAQLAAPAPTGLEDRAIYEQLALDDIRAAADVLGSAYDATGAADGYVSLEVNPGLAHDTEGTIEEARRLFAAVSRPNVMIKVPATAAGIPAIETLISEGVNVNVTLIFSLKQYEAVANAFITGLEKRRDSGHDVTNIASVASFFVSRVDTAVDKRLDALGAGEHVGKAAIANARLARDLFHTLFKAPRWMALEESGAQVQRLLWASTGTKNPAYSDTLYVDNLIGSQTVNTLPPDTLEAFLDHGTVEATLDAGLDEARATIQALSALGIDLDVIGEELQEQGVASFADSFNGLLASISRKRRELLSHEQGMTAFLGSFQEKVIAALERLSREKIVQRLWDKDHTIWKDDPREIVNRLGWLRSPRLMKENMDRLCQLARDLQSDGITDVILLGMGGSSLAPDMFGKVFGPDVEGLNLTVVDSTDPAAIRQAHNGTDPHKTVFIVSTKSGGTVETLSLFKHFYNWSRERVGGDSVGRHCIAITDPGSSLAKTADDLKFRAVFLNDPEIGGRYSALSYFGLVPAALVGADVAQLRERAASMADRCALPAGTDNPGAYLGAILGQLALEGRDKLTIVCPEKIAGLGDWIEQLIAESTGKEGKGILPVISEPVGAVESYAPDRVFVFMDLPGDGGPAAQAGALEQAGHPVIHMRLDDVYDIGGQLFVWEVATAVAGAVMQINPFDQPNVESAKSRAKEMLAEYGKKGELPASSPALQADGISVFGDVAGETPAAVLAHLLKRGEAGSYVAVQAYLTPSEAVDAACQELRALIRDRTYMATTFGYGPRFLHSTGQLHKGDAGKGLFVQITADAADDLPIPEAPGSDASLMTFGTLKTAQALGDGQALRDGGRSLIRLHIEGDVVKRIRDLTGDLRKILAD